MMKSFRFCGLILLLFCALDRFALAVETVGDNGTMIALPTTGTNLTTLSPPDSVKSVDEKGGGDEGKRSQVENEKKQEQQQIKSSTKESEQDSGKQLNSGSPAEKKDQPLKEPEPKSKENTAKESDNSGSRLNTASEEDSLAEDCDPSNRCIDEKNKLVACLRVPGKDSQDLSLLIQNKGEKDLNVSINTPASVKLDEAEVSLQGKENKEVKVSIDGVDDDTTIMLRTEGGSCKLNFSSMIPDSAQQSSRMAKYLNLPAHTSTIIFVFVGAIIVAALSFIRFWRTRRQDGVSKYQKVEMVLPVSTGGSKVSDETDGWDDSWGDGWDDDEETPKTPSKPVSTPSSKGLASRKSNKDGWKD